jgi:flagellar hook-associated protein 1 FlgK
MALGIALQNALSGLKASQQSFAVLSQNIANANNEDYSRQKISQTSQNIGTQFGGGVLIKSIERVADEFIETAVVNRTSDVSRARTVKEYYEQAQLYIGQPGNSNSIDSYVNDFFSSMTQLSTTPERSSVKLNAVNSGKILAQEISTLAGNLENLRLEADRQIKASVDNINTELKKIRDYNISIVSAKQLGNSENGIKDQMTTSLKKLSEEIDIKFRTNDQGQVFISTKGGVALLEDNLFELEYSPSSSIDTLVNDIDLKAVQVYSLNSLGERVGGSQDLVSAGSKDSVTTNLVGGKIKGLLEIRDTLIPDVLDQLDNMASVVRNQINAIHNDGSAFPPVRGMTGTRLVNPTQPQNWTGSFMLAPLKYDNNVATDGTAYPSHYASDAAAGIGMQPLKLDLANLDDGNGVGKPTMQTIIDEINRAFGTPKDRTSLQDSTGKTLLSDIKLGMKSDSLTGGSGTLSFDLDLSNLTANNATVQINSATIGSANATVSAPSFPASTTVAAGTSGRTGSGLQFDLNVTGAGTVAVTFNITVTDVNGLTSNSTVTFNIPEKTDDLLNDRIVASSVTGEAVIEAPTTTERYLTAKLVDADGNEVAKDVSTGDYTKSGYLVIEGGSAGKRIAIGELDSSHKGNASASIEATNFGFSHYMGLNDFFKGNDGGKADSAYNMAIRDDIIANAQRVTTGQLSLSPAQTISGALPKYTYQIANGSNQAAVKMCQLGLGNVSFDAAGNLPEISMTLSGYAAEILGYMASVTADAQQNHAKEDLIIQGFVEKDRNIRGVNIDEEMANTIIFQNAYSANARVISTASEMFKTLLDSF